MASPIAHTFAGFWTFLILAAQLKTRLAAQWREWLPRLGVLIFVANLPDLDFLFYCFDRNAKNLHHSFTHSLTFAILISLALSCVWRIVPGFWRSTLLYFTAYSSHLLDRLLYRNQDRVDSYWIWNAAVLAVVQRVQFTVNINLWYPSQRFCRLVQPHQPLDVHL